MSDDTTRKDETGANPADTEGQTAPPEGQKSIEDLKAKLGLRPKTAAPEVEVPRTQATSAQDFTLGLGPTGSSPRPVESAARTAPPITAADLGELQAAGQGGSRLWIWAALGLGLVMLVFGVFTGAMLKSRALENSKTREAAHLLSYFSETRVAQTGEGAGQVIDVIEAHVADVNRVFDAISGAADAQGLAAAEQELSAFLKRAKEFRDRKPIFLVEQAFPGVVFNGELAGQTVHFIQAVKQLYDDTVLLALEADTLDRVTELESTDDPVTRVVYVEPFQKDGDKWLKGTWIFRIDLENPRKIDDATAYAMLPLGGDQGFVARTSDLVELDVTPIARDKSVRYRGAILDRVRARLGSLKQDCDAIQYEPLKVELQRLANRDKYVTLF
jgi:hypothetical protein